jgi:predicted phage baseplate assembly protein
VAPTPLALVNRPGQARLRYRVGTYASIRAAMLRRIGSGAGLTRLTARGDDDFAIALLDLWAYVADVLTFYQERYANEAFLHTATQRDSVLRLAAAVAYRPRPSVAAETDLAFTLEAGKAITLPADLRVQSVPARPDDKPQKFETRGTLAADARLNSLMVVPVPQPLDTLEVSEGALPLGVTPASVTLPVGTPLVFYSNGTAVDTVRIEAYGQHGPLHTVRWAPALGTPRAVGSVTARRLLRMLRLFGHDAPASYTEAAVDAALGVRWTTTPRATWALTVSGDKVDLDRRYDDLAPGARLVFVYNGVVAHEAEVHSVALATVEVAPNTATVTRVTLTTALPATITDTRLTSVLEVGAELPLWDQKLPPDGLSGDRIAVVADAPLDALMQRGRRVMLITRGGAVTSARLAEPPVENTIGESGLRLWRLRLEQALGAWPWAGSVLLGNVLVARHGETIRDEVLGDGDATAGFQRFVPRRQPVAFEADADAPRGAASMVELRVNGVAWEEVPMLFGQAPQAEVFETVIDPELQVAVIAGDGTTGARLPSGRANVTARYRQGGGRAGNVNAGTLTTLLDRPLGLKAVVNPSAALGGTDAETLEEARSRAPTTVITLDRVVSLTDFAAAAREVPGIGKARAEWAWLAGETGVRLAVAGNDRTRVTDHPALLQALRRYLDARRDRFRRLAIVSHVDVDVVLEAVVYVEPRHRAEDVHAAAAAAVAAHFAFDTLALGQAVNLSDLLAVFQHVVGVRYVDVNRLAFAAASAWSDDELRRRGQSFTYSGAVRVVEPVQTRLLLAPEELARLASLNLTASLE